MVPVAAVQAFGIGRSVSPGTRNGCAGHDAALRILARMRMYGLRPAGAPRPGRAWPPSALVT